MNKRGLSGVVTVILIILLVLVAIGIIWSAIRPPIQETGDRLSGDCLTLNVEAVSCKPNGVNPNAWDVTFRRNAGAGSLTGIKLIFTDDSGADAGTTFISPTDGGALTELATQTMTVTPTGLSGAINFNVAALIQPGETPITCEVTNQPVNCA